MKREAGRADARRRRREIRRHTEVKEDVRFVPEDVVAVPFADRRRELVLQGLQRQAVELRAAERLRAQQVLRAGRWLVEQVVAGERSEEHTSELQSLMRISYAVFCLKKKKTQK